MMKEFCDLCKKEMPIGDGYRILPPIHTLYCEKASKSCEVTDIFFPDICEKCFNKIFKRCKK